MQKCIVPGVTSPTLVHPALPRQMKWLVHFVHGTRQENQTRVVCSDGLTAKNACRWASSCGYSASAHPIGLRGHDSVPHITMADDPGDYARISSPQDLREFLEAAA